MVTIDGIEIEIKGEKNVLELCRRAGIELPTFCYHPELSVFGACRMCMVEIDKMGILPACSTKPTDGMVIKTNTKQLRDIRRTNIELLLASHDQSCTTCQKSGDCKLQAIAKQLGVTDVRFKPMGRSKVLDASSYAVVRDQSKCILCGNCVRTCNEIQTVGALGFAYRGARAIATTAFNKPLRDTTCVGCGQCVKACPVGALMLSSQINGVWEAIYDPAKVTAVQIAPAVRVALGEFFGLEPGKVTTAKIVSALRLIGFNNVYDTCFGADMTVVEEGNEFLTRLGKNENMPLFTSCCPAWVKFVEEFYPDNVRHFSTCRSPQQMLGAVIKEQLGRDVVSVAVMPCLAKKIEGAREEFSTHGNRDVDFVISTKELALMIKERGIDFAKLPDGEFDQPFGTFSGSAVIFGASGGVSEAVLRFAAHKLDKNGKYDFKTLRDQPGCKITEATIAGKTLRIAVVSGLGNARKMLDDIHAGNAHFDIMEVMSCPGGCVNGGGQPITDDASAVAKRARGLYENDKAQKVASSGENADLKKLYDDGLTQKAHTILHTKYKGSKP